MRQIAEMLQRLVKRLPHRHVWKVNGTWNGRGEPNAGPYLKCKLCGQRKTSTWREAGELGFTRG